MHEAHGASVSVSTPRNYTATGAEPGALVTLPSSKPSRGEPIRGLAPGGACEVRVREDDDRAARAIPEEEDASPDAVATPSRFFEILLNGARVDDGRVFAREGDAVSVSLRADANAGAVRAVVVDCTVVEEEDAALSAAAAAAPGRPRTRRRRR